MRIRKTGGDSVSMFETKDSVILLVLSVVSATNLYDLYIDVSHGASRWHLLEEVILILVSIGVIVWLLLSLVRQRRVLARLREEIRSRPESTFPDDPKLREARHELGRVIQSQFARWSLTDSERAVALLLLKGLSFKEIAAVRNTLEKTVRQQASGIYKKAGVSGRHAFSAWFIEDFL
jgi:DNA-binding CsgD family transcriptional regulator